MRNRINRAVATQIVFDADPLLSISHPLRFKDIVNDVISASGEPTFERAKIILKPYGNIIPLGLQAVVGWKLNGKVPGAR